MRSRFAHISEEAIRAFTEGYRLSAEERADVAAYVRRRAGDVEHLLEHIMCSEPRDVDRFLELVGRMLESGEVPTELRGAVDASSRRLRRRAATMERQAARERRELAQSSGGSGGGGGRSGAAAGESLVDLALAIRGRQQARWASNIVESLEAKYCSAAAAAPSKQRRPAPLKRPAAAAPGGVDVEPSAKR
mmetsp:Transcript_3794/g.12567  ORF Transcript_3794/g.12567 Transcript_3794/m.12567 type:complete len:191 (-) Transcript_3794:28-600(-)